MKPKQSKTGWKHTRELVRLVRWYRVSKRIAKGDYPTAVDIARELEVAPKTINRDLDALRDYFDQELYYSMEEHGWYYLKPPEHFIVLGKRLSKASNLQPEPN